jgi:DNA mismatch repair protein MutS
MAKKGTETPLMRQYRKIKERHEGALLLFRMGDFYETFDDDAKTLARILGITLTKRSNGGAADVPLAGFPHHALEGHLPKLVGAGLRVAICEQLEDPKTARKIVKRDVVEVVTPGVILHDEMLDPRRSTYVMALRWGSGSESGRVGAGFLDASTGEFRVCEVPPERVADLLLTVAPAEVLVDKKQKAHLAGLPGGWVLTPQEDWAFGFDFAYETLLRHFKTHSLKGFGTDELRLGLRAAGAALHYASETQKGRLPQVRRLQRYDTSDHMALDPQTKRNLELTATIAGSEGSLIAMLDATQTPMGARLLRRWLVRPLCRVDQIEQRLDAVEALVGDAPLRARLREDLGAMADLERLAARLASGRVGPREVQLLRQTLEQIAPVKAALAGHSCDALRKASEALALCLPTVERIAATCAEDAPAKIGDGGCIKAGHNAELDELRGLLRDGKGYIDRLQKEESARTGIGSLKVGFNKVFGYYLEVTNTHKAKVPPGWTRKQTLVSAERYITPALKEYEEKVLSAEERIQSLEQQLFDTLVLALAEESATFGRNASLFALVDAFACLAEQAARNGYVRPLVDESRVLDIREGRHPVVEHSLPPGEPFIPNSVRLDPDAEVEGDAERAQMLVITGPNMAGKSVVLRQTGLIVLLAQIGSFVPADYARIGLVDRIFTRVGAHDNLAAGESTFLVEMNETANILNNATERSLVLLDEVGRGTSTFDGLSIAWALAEHLHDTPGVAARTLFATHYHELNALAGRLPRVANARVQVQEHEGKIIFLRRLVPGGADHSFGIEVARMAGLPHAVVVRAREVLAHLEAQRAEVPDEGASASLDADPSGDGAEPSGDGAARPVATPAAARTAQPVSPAARPAAIPQGTQMPLFAAAPDPAIEAVRDALGQVDVNTMTPIQALLKLAELKALAKG